MPDLQLQLIKFLEYWNQRLNITGGDRFLVDVYFILTIVMPISIFAYYVLDRYKTKTFIDLGYHKWIVRNKD
jgi:hypothetical protein